MFLEIDDKTYEWFKEAIAHMHEMGESENFEYRDDDARDIADMLEDCIQKQEEGDGPKLKVPCAYGTLVAQRQGDAGIYDEIEIDLVKPDGSLMQLCVAGTETFCEKPVDLHVYAWDGSGESANIEVHPNMETAVWY